jgi:8-oxo-dGTP diphosphatase
MVRVYGILIIRNKLLVARESFRGISMVKFPGGGLQFGEGTIDCLRREFEEEVKVPIATLEHFYTTEFFQESAFHEKTQILSIYYKVAVSDPGKIHINKPIREEHPDRSLSLHWENMSRISGSYFTFPIDQVVGEKLCLEWNRNPGIS